MTRQGISECQDLICARLLKIVRCVLWLVETDLSSGNPTQGVLIPPVIPLTESPLLGNLQSSDNKATNLQTHSSAIEAMSGLLARVRTRELPVLHIGNYSQFPESQPVFAFCQYRFFPGLLFRPRQRSRQELHGVLLQESGLSGWFR